jgi:hypothetical protein
LILKGILRFVNDNFSQLQRAFFYSILLPTDEVCWHFCWHFFTKRVIAFTISWTEIHRLSPSETKCKAQAEPTTIDWGSNPGQSIVMRRAARERKPQPDMAKMRRQRDRLRIS